MAKKEAEMTPADVRELGVVFDFSKVSRDWRKKMRRLGVVETRAQKRLQALYDADDFTDEALDAMMLEIDELEDQQNELAAAVLDSVPAAWLIEGAPDGLTFEKGSDVDYIRTDWRARLLQGVMIAAGNPAGN